MLTVIDGQGESSQHSRSIQINGAGLIDISTTKITPVTEQHPFEKALEDLNDHAKKRLYKGLQKDIANCLKISSTLLKKKSALIGKGDEIDEIVKSHSVHPRGYPRCFRNHP